MQVQRAAAEGDLKTRNRPTQR